MEEHDEQRLSEPDERHFNDPDERLFSEGVARLYRSPAALDPGARRRLDDVLRRLPAPRRSRAWLDWLFEPRLLTLRPVAVAATLAVAIAAGIVAGRAWPPREPAVELVPGAVPEGSARVVQFVLVAPGASSVAVVGDFNGWDATAGPMRRAADGETWSAALPLSAGHHVYAFVIDGERWMADPVAPLAPEDGFGSPNSVVLVGERDT